MADPTAQPGRWWRSDDENTPVPPGIDPTIPSPARMYDYYLGGKDNYAADRTAAEKALSVVPHGREIAQANRHFLAHAVVLMADHGVRQFIDLGTGIPTSPAVHELARTVQPDAHVLYVGNDRTVTVHNQAILAKSAGVRAVHGDIRAPYGIFTSPALEEFIDFGQPVGVLFAAVLHFIADDDAPEALVKTFKSYMVPGSYLALSHITSDGTDPKVMTAIQDAYAHASAPVVFRTRAQIAAFFTGLELEPPGLVDVTGWFPFARTAPAQPPAVGFLGGIGRMTGGLPRTLPDRYSAAGTSRPGCPGSSNTSEPSCSRASASLAPSRRAISPSRGSPWASRQMASASAGVSAPSRGVRGATTRWVKMAALAARCPAGSNSSSAYTGGA